MRALLSAFLALYLLACSGPAPVGAGPAQLRPSGAYLHSVTGLVVPERVGPFERRAVTRYDAEGFSISARYESVEPHTSLIFHHYPAGSADGRAALENLRAQFERAKHEGYHDMWRAQLVHERQVEFVINGVEVPGAHAVFRYPLSRQRRDPIESHLWLFAVGPWYLKFHSTSPQEEAHASFEAQKRFIRSFEWVPPP